MTIEQKVLNTMRRKNYGHVVSLSDLNSIANESSIRVTLKRMEETGRVKRIVPGVYAEYRTVPEIREPFLPEHEHIAMAIARKGRFNLYPTLQQSLHSAHIMQQVPCQIAYGTNKAIKDVKVGNSTYHFVKIPSILIQFTKKSECMIAQLLYYGEKQSGTERNMVKSVLSKIEPKLVSKVAEKMGNRYESFLTE